MGDISHGVKRKRQQDDANTDQVVPPGVALVEQRKSILDISMFKLKLVPCKHEPSLRRSVLIFNTLKYIENELKEEGVKLNPASTPCLLPTGSDDTCTLDPLPPAASPVPPTNSPSASSFHGHSPSPLPKCEQDSPLSVSLSVPSKDITDVQASQSQSVPRTAVSDTVSDRTNVASLHSSFSASLPESWDSWASMVSDSRCILDTLLTSSDRLTVTSFTSLFDLDTGGAVTAAASPSIAMPQCSTATGIATSSSNFGATSVTSPSPSTKSPESFLSDLDLSLLEGFDLFSPMPGKLPSLSPDELTNSLPTCNDAFATLNTSCNPKHESYFSEDLDHIMQVLVGI